MVLVIAAAATLPFSSIMISIVPLYSWRPSGRSLLGDHGGIGWDTAMGGVMTGGFAIAADVLEAAARSLVGGRAWPCEAPAGFAATAGLAGASESLVAAAGGAGGGIALLRSRKPIASVRRSAKAGCPFASGSSISINTRSNIATAPGSLRS